MGLYAMQNGITLDYTRESVKDADTFPGICHDSLDRYDGDEGAKTLWRTYALINTDCANTERVNLVTPPGQYIP